MRKLFLAAFTICLHSSFWLQAQISAPLSGIYQKLTLGVDLSQGTVTGYYSDIDDPPNLPSSECSFFLSGQRQGDKYVIQAWDPGKHKTEAIPGELTIFSADKGRPSALLKLEKLSRDCSALNPKLGKAEGALLDKSQDGGWTEVRVVGNSKASYYQAPEQASPQRGSAKRGTVLLVTEGRAGWIQVQGTDQKAKGWLQNSDLYPLNPGETMAMAVKPASPVATVASPEPKAEPKAAATERRPDSKAELLQRLNALNVQAFGLALRALADPSERKGLLSPRLSLEKELDALVADLNKIDPSAYRHESARIFEAYLDLQYVRQEQPVVSLRLRQEILKK